MEFAAVIFDCDGVLVDSEALGVTVERETLASVGLPYSASEFKTRFVGLDDTAYHAALAGDARDRFGVDLPEGTFARMKARKMEVFAARLAAMDGAAALAARIAAPKAVASSADSDELVWKLRQTGLIQLFEPHVYSAQLVGRGKPAPDIYLHAAAQLGADPRGCLAVEDSVNGVMAAVAAGMTVFGFLGGGHIEPGHAARLADAGAAASYARHADIGARLGV